MNCAVLVLLLAVATAWPSAAATTTRARARVPRVRAAKPSTAAADARARTLDDIHIEGEIPVPQVLFITARDQRRFLDFQHHRYLRSSAQLGEATAPPRLIVVTPSPSPAGKETAR